MYSHRRNCGAFRKENETVARRLARSKQRPRQLAVKANGSTLHTSTIGPSTTKNGWAHITVDLSKLAGQKVTLELLNRANGWNNEFGYWGRIAIESTAEAGENAVNPTVRADPGTPRESSSQSVGWVSLFNGKDLTGWQDNGPSHSWTVKDGAIVASPASNWSLLKTTRNDYANVHLRVETRQVEGNSAALDVRSTTTTGEGTSTYLADIAGTGKTEPATGDFGRIIKSTGRVYLSRAKPFPPVKPGAWFTQEIIADGNTFTVIVQDQEVVKVTDANRTITAGSIALWCAANSRAAFRKVEVKELTTEKSSKTNGASKAEKSP